MNQAKSMSGKYYRTSMNDIRSSEGWFGKICLLGLISFIPVFGQMTIYGYAYEWAHKAAWGLNDPMPKKIYGRPGSKMLRWGWFAIVIAFVFAIIPTIISSIGNTMSNAGAATTAYTMYGSRAVNPGNPALMGFGYIISLVGAVLTIVAYLFSWVGTIRMTIYDRLGTGLQFGTVWKMAKKDFGGLMRILGMAIIWWAIVSVIVSIVVIIMVMVVGAATILPLAAASQSSMASESAIISALVSAAAIALPFMIILCYFTFVVSALIQLLVSRAVGYWVRQFDVPAWGPKDEPLPFERQAAQQQTPYQYPQQPVQQAAEPVQQQAAEPTQAEEPVQQQAAEPVQQQVTAESAQQQAAEPVQAAEPEAAPAPEADTPQTGQSADAAK